MGGMTSGGSVAPVGGVACGRRGPQAGRGGAERQRVGAGWRDPSLCEGWGRPVPWGLRGRPLERVSRGP